MDVNGSVKGFSSAPKLASAECAQCGDVAALKSRDTVLDMGVDEEEWLIARECPAVTGRHR